MKVNIIECQIKLSALEKALADYNYETSKYPNYIIMNKNTFNELKKIVDYHYDIIKNEFKSWDAYPLFEGCPIAICEKLQFGEIEVV